MQKTKKEAVNWIWFLKEKIQTLKQISTNTQKDLIEIQVKQEELLKHIIQVFSNDCVIKLQDDKNFQQIKKQILSWIKNLQWENKKLIEVSETMDKWLKRWLSLIKTFYYNTTKDKLTGLWNSEYINNMLDVLWYEGRDFTFVYLDLNDLKKVNDKYWHNIWDKVILELARNLKLLFWDNWQSYVARIHWDEFNIISLLHPEEVKHRLERLDKWLENQSLTIKYDNQDIKLNISVAWGVKHSSEYKTIWELVHNTDKQMYMNKIEKKKQ